MLKWKLELADALISESVFNGMAFEPGTDLIEHQLGTVWVGDISISMMELEEL